MKKKINISQPSKILTLQEIHKIDNNLLRRRELVNYCYWSPISHTSNICTSLSAKRVHLEKYLPPTRTNNPVKNEFVKRPSRQEALYCELYPEECFCDKSRN